jgi:hypothetical protein
LTKGHFSDSIFCATKGPGGKSMVKRTIKHRGVILWILFIASCFFVFKTSDEPILWLFRNTWVEFLLQQFPTGNSIIFDLSIGFVVSCIFYVLIVWLPKRSKALRMKRDSSQFRDVPTQGNGCRRWYYIEVENLHNREIAHYCLVYIESLKNLSTGVKTLLPLIELKWKGLLTQSASIPPKRSRCFDGFYVFPNSPDAVHLGFNRELTDDPSFPDDYTIRGPGDFELTFIIYSANFLPEKATFRLHIGSNLDDIRFE